MKTWALALLILTLGCVTLPLYGAVVDLRDFSSASQDLILLPSQWEYSATPLIPGTKPGDEEASPLDYWKSQPGFPDSVCFRLHLLLRPNQKLTLVMGDFPSYRLIANGKPLLEKGRIKGQADLFESLRGRRIASLPEAEDVELILYANTPAPRWSPKQAMIKLGNEEFTRTLLQLDTIVLAAVLGGLFFIGLYHVIVFLFFPDQKVTLILGIFSILNTLRLCVSGETDTLFLFYPNMDYELSFKLSSLCYYIAPPLFLFYLEESFPKTVAKRSIVILFVPALAFGLFALLVPVGVFGPANRYFHLFTAVAIVLGLTSIVRAFSRKRVGSRLMMVACTAVTLSAINEILYSEHLPSFGRMFSHIIMLVLLLQSAMLLSKFSASFNELAHTSREFTKIAYSHTVKMIAGGMRLELTMPVGKAEATVLAFDIIGSSRIIHPDLSIAVDRMMGRCYEAMTEDYDAETMVCRAYRIKEMGDGLLCSVGFPFATRSGQSQASIALYLAEEFSRIFQEQFERLELPDDVYCAIGIVRGEVEGYFPLFGVKQYDLRGKTIGLATRYESMRNPLFTRTDRRGSVIFIHDDVYDELDPEARARFELWDALQKGGQIRDDEDAKRAWYRFLPPAKRKGSLTAIESDGKDEGEGDIASERSIPAA